MNSISVWSPWAARVCLAMVTGLVFMGYNFANIRFAPMAAGFAILAWVCHTWRSGGGPHPRR